MPLPLLLLFNCTSGNPSPPPLSQRFPFSSSSTTPFSSTCNRPTHWLSAVNLSSPHRLRASFDRPQLGSLVICCSICPAEFIQIIAFGHFYSLSTSRANEPTRATMTSCLIGRSLAYYKDIWSNEN